MGHSGSSQETVQLIQGILGESERLDVKWASWGGSKFPIPGRGLVEMKIRAMYQMSG